MCASPSSPSKPQPAVTAFLGIAVLFALRRSLEVSHHYLAGVRIFLQSRRRQRCRGHDRVGYLASGQLELLCEPAQVHVRCQRRLLRQVLPPYLGPHLRVGLAEEDLVPDAPQDCRVEKIWVVRCHEADAGEPFEVNQGGVNRLESALPRLEGKFRALLWGGVAATALVSAGFAVRVLDCRFTNVDLLAKQVDATAGENDFAVVTPWQFGITFGHYFTNRCAWETVPPIADHSTERFDLLLAQMKNTNATQPLLERVGDTLRGGHTVWLVGGCGDAPGTSAPASPPPPPLPRTGWHETPYRFAWNNQLGWYLRLHGAKIECLDPGPQEALADRVAFERSLQRAGFRAGVSFKNPGMLLREIAAAAGPVAAFSGHAHRGPANEVNRRTMRARTVDVNQMTAGPDTFALVTAPALGQVTSPRGERPGYLLARFEKGALAGLRQCSLEPNY